MTDKVDISNMNVRLVAASQAYLGSAHFRKDEVTTTVDGIVLVAISADGEDEDVVLFFDPEEARPLADQLKDLADKTPDIFTQLKDKDLI